MIDERDQAIIDLYLDGERVRSIADMFELTPVRVNQVLRSHQVPVRPSTRGGRPPKFTFEDCIAAARRFRDAGGNRIRDYDPFATDQGLPSRGALQLHGVSPVTGPFS